MLRFVALLTLFLGASPVLAEPGHFTGETDGVSYDYTAEIAPRGQIILRGKYLKTDASFELIVNRFGHVEGVIADVPVSFDVSQKDRDKALSGLQSVEGAHLADSTTQR
jgi:hypothetical protein